MMSYLCCKNRTNCSKDALGTFWMYVSLFPEFGRRACVCLCVHACVYVGDNPVPPVSGWESIAWEDWPPVSS